MIFVRKGEDPPWIVAGSLWEPVRGRVGRPRRRPDCLYADRGYDHDKYQRLIRAKGVKHRIGRRGVEHGSGLGKHRYVVERTIALLHWCRRLRIRWEIRDDIHEALLSLAAALICWRLLATTHPRILLGVLVLTQETCSGNVRARFSRGPAR